MVKISEMNLAPDDLTGKQVLFPGLVYDQTLNDGNGGYANYKFTKEEVGRISGAVYSTMTGTSHIPNQAGNPLIVETNYNGNRAAYLPDAAQNEGIVIIFKRGISQTGTLSLRTEHADLIEDVDGELGSQTDYYQNGVGEVLSLISDGSNWRMLYAKPVKAPTSYSTTESLTGMTWIDEKPIYRKVFTFPAAALVSGLVFTQSLASLNIETMISMSSVIKDENSDISTGAIVDNNMVPLIQFQQSGINKDLVVYVDFENHGEHNGGFIIIEYTKN